MADLSANLSQVGSAVLSAAAAAQFQSMNAAYNAANPGKNITPIQGYMSVWDWAQEASSLWGTHHDANMQNIFATTIRPLLDKADASQEDFDKINEFFGNQVRDGRNPNSNTSVYDFSKLPATLAGSAWAAYTKTKVSWAHPYFQAGTYIYGVPNTINKDPRRTGNFVSIDMKASGDDVALSWLFSNSHNYGFYWYGPTVESWMFLDPATTKLTAAKKEILTKFSYHANGYYSMTIGANKPKPTTRAEIKAWGATVGPRGEWIMSGLTYEEENGQLHNYNI